MNARKKALMVFTMALMIMSIPGMSMASGTDTVQEINLLNGGYVVYDAAGKIMPQPNTSIDSGAISIPAGGKVKFSKAIAYTKGDKISYYVSVTGGHVDELQLSIYKPQDYTIGYFTATQGDWYGTIANKTLSLSTGNYYYAVDNKSNVSIRIDSLTCLY